ncbi:MAG: DNA-protecting protein DprA [Magnetococcales bacterium]|nr:DNA-protecting protein DprA [Magnetococcales bacterium]
MERSTLIDWLRLVRVPGLGPMRLGLLQNHFLHPGEILAASVETIRARIPSLPRPVLAGLQAAARPEAAADAATELDRLQAMGGQVLVRGEPGYPRPLAEIHDPPVVLFVQGNPDHLQARTLVAIVGSRDPTPPGAATARRLATEMATQEIVVVSGLAVGIDSAAHLGALEGGGPTVAVLATGLDINYPPTNQTLRKRIAAHGCLVTEAVLGIPPAPALFPPRNRIISGLSQGVVVVEAAMRSGSLITARMALEQGREVFAVPGMVANQRSRGCHRLLREGARLVEDVNDILEELHWTLGKHPVSIAPTSRNTKTTTSPKMTAAKSAASPAAAAPPIQPSLPFPPPEYTPTEVMILDNLKKAPAQTDELARSCQLTVATLSRILLDLELAGVVQRSPGNIFCLKIVE